MAWLALIWCCSNAAVAQQPLPDGTLVFSNLETPFGRWLNRVGPMRYSHVAVVLRGTVYEADWPRVQGRNPATYGRRHGVYEYWVPTTPLPAGSVAQMHAHATGQLGRPYGVARWLAPGTRLAPHKIYCSEFARDTLRAGGWQLPPGSGYDPGQLHAAVQPYYQYSHTVRK